MASYINSTYGIVGTYLGLIFGLVLLVLMITTSAKNNKKQVKSDSLDASEKKKISSEENEVLALEGRAAEYVTLALDERKVWHLEGDGHGDQLISASNTGRNGPCLHALKSQWLLLFIC